MITLENESLLIRIGTGRGARVESFLDKETGKDWVWKPDNYKSQHANKILDLAAGFDDNWAGGWEEIFPNDAPSEYAGYKLVDHGEVWRRSWVQEESDSLNEVSFSINCETYPMFVKKRYVLNDNFPELIIQYEIESRASQELPYIFKLHPALAIETDDEFRMPSSKMEPVALGFSRLLGEEKLTPFPIGHNSQGEPVAINKVHPNDNHLREFVKISELSKGQGALFNKRSQKELRFCFKQDVLSYIWLFQSYGGFMNHYVAMLEPTNAGHYDLAQASQNNQCGRLMPGELKSFSISISLCGKKE